MRKCKAFTLFEIIIAMLVIGILSALAAPKVVDLVNEARRGDELNTVGNVKSGIALTYLGNVTRGITPQYPSNLDNAQIAKASPANPVFDLVLQHGITKDWEKLQLLRYRGPTGREYEYDSTDGTFEEYIAPPTPPPPASFTATFGGTNNDIATSVLATSDGGYLIAGYTADPYTGRTDFYIVKTDAFGNILWQNTYGGSGFENLWSIQETSDGGYIMAGMINTVDDAVYDAYVMKIDSSGTMVWENRFGKTSMDYASSIQETSGGGYIMAGMTLLGAGQGDAYLVKIDSSGTAQWEKTYGGIYGDSARKVQQTSDGGYIMAGSSWLSTDKLQDFYLVKTDSSGNRLWEMTYGGSKSDFGYDIKQTSDSGYVMAGQTLSFGAGSADVYLIKTDSAGTTQWTKTYGGSSAEEGYEAQQTSDGGYVIVGTTRSFGSGGSDVYLIKTDSAGTTQWTKTYGGIGDESGASVQESPYGGYIIGASAEGNFYLIKTDADGNVQ